MRLSIMEITDFCEKQLKKTYDEFKNRDEKAINSAISNKTKDILLNISNVEEYDLGECFNKEVSPILKQLRELINFQEIEFNQERIFY